mmetsp:Transcript_99913/g.282780  ORF Transcript_99913/g.282780 Transcript_99913/m.282780 type:complete len:83 (+) Transcript_99913:58-306(+)
MPPPRLVVGEARTRSRDMRAFVCGADHPYIGSWVSVEAAYSSSVPDPSAGAGTRATSGGSPGKYVEMSYGSKGVPGRPPDLE